MQLEQVQALPRRRRWPVGRHKVVSFSSPCLLICDPPATSDDAGPDGGRSRPALYQNGTSTWPLVVFASSWFDSWKPKTYGEWGLVPYGMIGSVLALAIGARVIAPPIPAMANHG